MRKRRYQSVERPGGYNIDADRWIQRAQRSIPSGCAPRLSRTLSQAGRLDMALTLAGGYMDTAVLLTALDL
jgi:hypothetical protein